MSSRHLSAARTGPRGRRRGAGRATLRSPIHGLAGQRAWRRIHTRSERREHAGAVLVALRPRAEGLLSRDLGQES